MLLLLETTEHVSEADVTDLFTADELSTCGEGTGLMTVFRHYINTALQEYAFSDASAAQQSLQKLLSIPLFQQVCPDLHQRIKALSTQSDQKAAMKLLTFLSQRLDHLSLIWQKKGEVYKEVKRLLSNFPKALYHPDLEAPLEEIRIALAKHDLSMRSKSMDRQAIVKELQGAMTRYRAKVDAVAPAAFL